MSDPFDLQRFVDGQADDYDRALAELRAGCKRTHWMWYVFPQIKGLGSSEKARRYAIRDLDEARAYLAHPVLGRRLVECAKALTVLDTTDARDVLDRDAKKLRSSMTLFMLAAPEEPVFREVLDQYFRGRPDEGTTRLLGDPPIRP